MRIMFLLSVLVSASAFSNQSIYDLAKAGEIEFSLNSTCKAFFTDPSKRAHIQSAKIRSKLKTLNELGFNNFFYHYTNVERPLVLLRKSELDREKAEVEIDKEGGYAEILKHQMTYSGAMSNAAGNGLYVAGNPFSSSGYGHNQIEFKVASTTRVFDSVSDGNLLNQVIISMRNNIPQLFSCPSDMYRSIILDENDADLVLYSGKSVQWFVLFNEDIIEQSRVHKVATQNNDIIMKRMAENGQLDSLVGYLDILSIDKHYSYSFENFLSHFEEGRYADLKDVDRFTDVLLETTPVKGNELVYVGILNKLEDSLFNKYYNIFVQDSFAFKDFFLNTLITNENPAYLNKYNQLINLGNKPKSGAVGAANLYTLHDKGVISNQKFETYIAASIKFEDLYDQYSNSEYNNGVGVLILEHMLENDPEIFRSLDRNKKYNIINYYLTYGKANGIKGFINKVELTGYPVKESFDYIRSYQSNYKAENIQAFTLAYMEKNQSLILDSSIMNSLLPVMIKLDKPNTKLLQSVIDNIDINRDVFDRYLNSYRQSDRSDFQDLLLNSQALKELTDTQKNYLYNSILKSDGVGSSKYFKLISIANITLESEYNYFISYMRDKEIYSDANRAKLLLRVSKDQAIKDKISDFSAYRSALTFFSYLDDATKTSEALVRTFPKELLANIATIRRVSKQSPEIAKAVYNYDFVSPYFQDLEKETQQYLLELIFNANKDIKQAKNLVNKMVIDEPTANSILQLVNYKFADTDFYKVFLTYKDILYKSDRTRFSNYIKKLKGVDIINAHSQILLSDKLGFSKARSVLRAVDQLSTGFIRNFVGIHFTKESLDQSQISTLANVYGQLYPKLKESQSIIWDQLKELSDNDLTVIAKSTNYFRLSQKHKEEVILFSLEKEPNMVAVNSAMRIRSKSSIYNAILLTKNDEYIRKIMPTIEANYPYTKDHITAYMDYYSENKQDFLKTHLKQLCTKYKGYKGLRSWIKNSRGSVKKLRKLTYNNECK